MAKTIRSLATVTVLLFVGLSLTLVVMLTTFHSVSADTGVIYVDRDAPGPTHDGLSWTTAFTNVQAALAVAISSDEIWVAEGVYTPGSADQRDATFTLKDGVAVYGGFAATETLRTERDWAANVTVLSGDIDQNDTTDPHGVVTTTANIVGNNAYHVVTGGGTDNTAVLDGFILSAGQANGSYPNDRGGGMYDSVSSPTLTNVTFSGNTANWGGGMYNENNSSPTLTDVSFSGNTAFLGGGGMYNENNSSPTLTDVSFSGNTALLGGGGMYSENNSSPTLTDVTFSGNTANDSGLGGGMFTNNFSNPTLTNVTFSGNTANYEGGGMFNYMCSNPTLTNVTFSSNTANYEGGGMYNHNSSPTLTNVTFSSNTATNWGGGMYNLFSSPTLMNVILWGDSAPSGPEIYNDTTSAPTIAHSDVQGCGGSGSGWDSALGTDGGGNIDVAPLFVDPNNGNLRLGPGSPAIDAGNNTACPSHDLDGVSRPVGFGCDMGAYERDAFAATVSKWASELTPVPGQVVTFTVAVTNTGPGLSGGLISDTLPAGLNFVGPITLDPPEAGVMGSTPPTLAHSLVISANHQVTVTFPISVAWGLEGGTHITNTAAFTAPMVPAGESASVVLVSVSADTGIIYVDRDTPGPTHDGLSWTTAFTNVQAALAAAVSSDEIWVAEGVYTPGSADQRDATFTLKNGVALYGGFAATEAARDQRDWTANITVLSGDIDGNDLTDPHGVVTDTANIVGNNAYHVVTGGGTDNTAMLDGFILTAGQANGSDPNNSGGGMINVYSHPTLTNVTFSGNLAEQGGGMRNGHSNPTLTGIDFSCNLATASGGGMVNDNNSSPTLTNVTFSGNSASDLGGGIANDLSQPTLTNVTFSSNSTSNGGGGMANNNNSSPTLINVTFSGNSASNAGGGMANYNNSGPMLTDITFSGNSATWYGGGMYNENNSSPTLTNVILWGDSAPDGPEIYNQSSTPGIAYSDLQGCGGSGSWNSACGTDFGGNLEADPLFVDAANGNLRLQDTSPAIDAGDDNAVPVGVTTDLDGNPRFSGAAVDMGAYEFQTTTAYRLLVTRAGKGLGRVTSDPAGIACPGDCSQVYAENAAVVLTATVGPYTSFDGWQGCDNPSGNTCTLTLSTHKEVTATLSRTGCGVLYAAPTAQGSGDCSGWANACTLQYALTGAISGDEIWVQAGVHKATANPAGRTATFTLKDGVAVYGGFAGTETARDQRDWAAHVTVLSGDIDGNDITDPHGVVTDTANIVGDNSYHVVRSSGVTETARLDGFTITAGQANGDYPNVYGGGMYNEDNSSPTLTDVTFSGNTATNRGGGMYNYWYSNPTLTNVTFSGNTANYGGGMFNHYSSSPTLTDVTFSGNTATNRGGGMCNYYSSSPTLTDVTFSGNTATNRGGGMYNYDYSSPTLTNVTFSGNTATNWGGGMYNENNSSPTLTNVILWGDSAPNGPETYNDSSTPVIAYSDLQGCGGSGSWNTACGTDNGGNIDADPLFVDAANGNLRLQDTSPAIDAGDSDSVPPGLTTDLDGNPRFSGAAVDMGAYEFQTTTAYRLLVTRAGNGLGRVTSDPAGIACPGDCSQVYAENAAVVLTATVGPYTSFDGWQGCDNPSGNTCTLTLSTHKEVTATLSRTGCGVLYAAPTAQGSGDCSGWANACTLQYALTGAISGDEIWVQAGVHKATANPAGRTATFTLKDGVAVYGGFAGTETARDQRDWAAHVTVLSGDIDGNDITDPHGVVTDTANIVGANSYHVVTGGGTNATVVLDGFVITAGQANGSGPANGGGGMYNDKNSSPTLMDVTFSGNTADSGGGMYNENNSSPTLTDVTFSGNTATYGGGMRNYDSSPTLTNVTFSGNTAMFSGGGMSSESSSPTLTDVTFSGNTATNRGGGMSNYGGSPTLTNVTFSGNTATIHGGGMCSSYSSPTLTNVTFSGNTATNGGGMYNGGSSPMLTNVTFSGNTATYHGGGMCNYFSSSPTLTDVTFSGNTATDWGGGMYNENNSSPTLTNVTFNSNTAYNGGGMYNHQSSATLTDVTFSGNTATIGGGMYNYGSSPTLSNVTFSGNAADSQGGGMYNANSSPTLTNVILWGDSAPSGPEIYNDTTSAPTIAYSDVQGCGGSGSGWNSACGTDNGHNLDADPLFVDADSGNLRLQVTSPAIDAGDNTAVPGGITTDLDGNPRFVDIPTAPDTGNGAPPIVDMGAYETQQYYVDVALGKAVAPPEAALGQAITFTLTISNGGSITATHVVVTDTLPFLSGTSFTSTVVVTDTGHSPPYVWTVQDLAPGQGGVITLTGVLTAPLAAGTYTNTATIAADDDLWDDNNMVSVTFTVLNVAPAFTSTPVTTATQDVPYTYTATTEDANGDALTLTAPTLPAWLTLTDHGDGTATLCGTPTNADVGDHAVVLEVTDSGGLYATQSFTITVVEEPWYRIYLPLALRNTP